MENDDRTLFIANLDKNVSEEILYELFLQAGPIERVSIPRGKNDSSRYGFVTYKHECSIDYAINLFKGTTLFKKELFIKKRCSKNINSQQSREFNKFDIIDAGVGRQNLCDFQEQLLNLKLWAQNLNNCQAVTNLMSNGLVANFKSCGLRGNRSNRNRPYDLEIKNNFSRPRGARDKQKNRDQGGKMYHRRKNRHRR